MFCRGNFKTAAQLLRRGNIVFALLYQGLKLADITSAVTVLKITHFTSGAEGVWGDRFAGNSQLAINNCKVLTLTGHGPGLFAVGKKRQWNDRPRLADDYNWTRLLPYCKNFAGHGVTACLGRKNLGKTGLIPGPDNMWIMSREWKLQGIRQRTSCESLFELLSHLWDCLQWSVQRLSSCVSNYCHTREFVENWFGLNDSSVSRAKIQKISGRTQPQSEMLAVLSYVERQDVAIFCVFRMRLCWKHFKFCFSGCDLAWARYQ